MTRRKYNQGRLIPERWVFGGYDTTTKVGFFVFVQDRSAATLLPLIRRFVAPGSHICTDNWASYNHISEILVEPPYTHSTVNHSQNFVNPETATTTNHVEKMWCDCKRRLKQMNGTTSEMLPTHLDEFMWRQFRGKTVEMAFNNILDDMSRWYVV